MIVSLTEAYFKISYKNVEEKVNLG